MLISGLPRGFCNSEINQLQIQMAKDGHDRAKLPEDLLIMIFLQSSVETLLRAKYVSKHWYDIIKNPIFVADHHQYQKSHNKGRLLFQYFMGDPEKYNYALFDDETLNTYKDIDHLQLEWRHLHIQGQVNGLYCLSNKGDRIVLWNPALRELKTLPLPHPHFFPNRYVCEGLIGFGIDLSTQDYKLVMFRIFKDGTNMYPNKYVTIYNLTTNTWRLLTNCNFQIVEWCVYRNDNSSFLNGSCHWWTRFGKVIAFDMAEEKFREIPAPNFCLPANRLVPPTGSITIHNGKLALMLHWQYSADVWVMLEEGAWVKQFSISSIQTNLFSEVEIWKKDGLFVTLDDDPSGISQLALYDSSSQEMRVVGPEAAPSCFQVSLYHESLVPAGNGTKYKGRLASLSSVSGFLNRDCNPYLYMPKEEYEFVSIEAEDECDCEGER